MKEKDFKLIYENLYEGYLDTFIKEIEDLYMSCKKEGDAVLFAYNECNRTLLEKTMNLKIKSNPYSSIYAKFKDRYSFVQNNNLNRLYVKHIVPLCDDLKIEINENQFEDLLNEFALSDASSRIRSWFGSWENLYSIMFQLDDFSEFKIIRNCSYSEGSDIFKRFHKKLHPESYIEEILNFNFSIKEEYEVKIKGIYDDLTVSFINEKRTSQEDFENVFLKDSKSHNSVIHFFSTTESTAYLLWKLEFAFRELNFTNVEKSNLFYSKNDRPMRQKSLSNSKTAFISKIGSREVDILINEVDSILKKLNLC